MNILVLAYLGDSIYETYLREYFIKKGISKVNSLQNEVTKYTSAKGQAEIVNKLILNNVLTNEELEVFKRGRNAKSNSKPKNTDIITYKIATGFEALIGDLFIKNNIIRIEKIIEHIVDEINEKN